MKVQTAAPVMESGPLSTLWENRAVRIALQVLLIAGFSAVAAIGKKFDPSLGIPGSGGIYWLLPMVILRSIVKRDGAGLMMGIGMAAWAIPIGGLKQDHAFIYHAALYGGAGVMMDLVARLPKVNINHPVGAVLCGFSAHMVKYGFVVYTALASSLTKHVLAVGLLNSALLHAAVGVGAGLIAWSLTRGSRRLLGQSSKGDA